MSRQELAQTLNAYQWRTHHIQDRLDGTDIGKYERGRNWWPSERRREAFRAALNVDTDAQLGFYTNRQHHDETDDGQVDRTAEDRLAGLTVTLDSLGSQDADMGKALVGGPATAPLLSRRVDARRPARPPGSYVPFLPAALDRPALDWLCDEDRVPPPTASTATSASLSDVESAARTLESLRQLDHELGGVAVGGQVAAFLDRVEPALLGGGAGQDTAAAAYRVAIGARELAGYQAVDSGADGLAQRHYLRALTLTRAAGDRALGAYLLGVSLGHLALHCGHADRSLRMAQIAIKGVAADATHAVHAALWAVRARAFARLGDEQGCTSALRTAEQCLSASDPATEPSWIAYLTQAYLADEVAHCMFDLGCHDSARYEVQQAVDGIGSSRVRRLAIDTALLASSLAAQGQVDEACAHGRAAVDLAARTGSVRAVQRVAQVRADLVPFDGTREVAEFIDYVRAVLPAAL